MQQSELTVVVAYRCANCQAALEAGTGAARQGWLRCPRCGRASLPPDPESAARADSGSGSVSASVSSLDDDVLVIPASSEFSGTEPTTGYGARRSYPAGAVRRVMLLLGFLIALSGIVTGFVRGNPVSVAAYGVIMMAVFAVAAATSRRR